VSYDNSAATEFVTAYKHTHTRTHTQSFIA